MNIVEALFFFFFYGGHTNAESFIAMHTLTLLPDEVVEKCDCAKLHTFMQPFLSVNTHPPIS